MPSRKSKSPINPLRAILAALKDKPKAASTLSAARHALADIALCARFPKDAQALRETFVAALDAAMQGKPSGSVLNVERAWRRDQERARRAAGYRDPDPMSALDAACEAMAERPGFFLPFNPDGTMSDAEYERVRAADGSQEADWLRRWYARCAAERNQGPTPPDSPGAPPEPA